MRAVDQVREVWAPAQVVGIPSKIKTLLSARYPRGRCAAIPARSSGTLFPRPGSVVSTRFQTLSVVQAGDNSWWRQSDIVERRAWLCQPGCPRSDTPGRSGGCPTLDRNARSGRRPGERARSVERQPNPKRTDTVLNRHGHERTHGDGSGQPAAEPLPTTEPAPQP